MAYEKRYETIAPPPSPVTAHGVASMMAERPIKPIRVEVRDCVVPKYAFESDQTRISHYLEAFSRGGKPLVIGRQYRGLKKVDILVGGSYVRQQDRRAQVEVLCGKFTDLEAVQIAILIGGEIHQPNRIQIGTVYKEAMGFLKAHKKDLAAWLGVTRQYVTNHVGLLELTPAIRSMIAAGTLSFTAGRSMLGMKHKGEDVCNKVARDAANTLRTSREVSKIVFEKIDWTPKSRKSSSPAAIEKPVRSDATVTIDSEAARLNTALSDVVGSPVTLRDEGNSGLATVVCHSLEAAEGVLAKLSERLGSAPMKTTIAIELSERMLVNHFIEQLIPRDEIEDEDNY